MPEFAKNRKPRRDVREMYGYPTVARRGPRSLHFRGRRPIPRLPELASNCVRPAAALREQRGRQQKTGRKRTPTGSRAGDCRRKAVRKLVNNGARKKPVLTKNPVPNPAGPPLGAEVLVTVVGPSSERGEGKLYHVNFEHCLSQARTFCMSAS